MRRAVIMNRGQLSGKSLCLPRGLGQRTSWFAMDHEAMMSKGVYKTFELSAMQKGMLVFSLASEMAAYVQQLICRIRYEINLSAFERAWQLIFNRHESLRTAFRWQGLDEPIQDVYRNIKAVVKIVDLSMLSGSEQHRCINEYVERDRERQFDFAVPPLVRLTLFQLAQRDFFFLLTTAHTVLDGRSRKIIIEELFQTYESLCNGADSGLAEAPQFSQFIAWLQQQDFTLGKQYWRNLFAGENASLCANLPCKKSSDAGRRALKSVPIDVSAIAGNDLERLARDIGVTLNTLVQGCWAALLQHYSGLHAVTFGATRACRRIHLEEASRIAGVMINTLPLRVQFQPQARFIDVFRELRAQSLAVRPFECTPLPQVHEWVGIEGMQQLFESIVVFDDYSVSHLPGLANCQYSPSEIQRFGNYQYPLSLFGYGHPESFLEIMYDPALFDAALVEQMSVHYRTLLEQLPANLERHLADIPTLTRAEHEQIVGWNETEVDYPEGCIHELFGKQTARTPQQIAVQCAGQQLTFQELDQQSNQLAHYLQKHGIGPETRVGVCLDRDPHMLVALLGILKSGGAYVPIDPRYPSDRINFILRDTKAAALLINGKYIAGISSTETEILVSEEVWKALLSEDTGSPEAAVNPGNAAYVIYTSGSTGRPKGVVIEHRSAVAFLCWARASFPAEDLAAMLASTSICFDLSVFEIFVPLTSGGTVILAENVLVLAEVAQSTPVRLLNSVPSLVAELLRNGKLPSCVRTVNLAGEPLSETMVDALYQHQHVKQVFDLYGPSEYTTYTTWALRLPGTAATIGRPIANTKLYVLDAWGRPVPKGVAGELYIGGKGLTRGYFGRPDLTAERLLPDPFSSQPGARLYRTGDLARYDRDGNLEYLGRLDQQIKLRGFRIELGEIQSALEEHPAVERSVVIVTEGEEKRLAAYIVFRPGDRPSRADLAAFLRQKLPAYMVPSTFVPLNQFPLTHNGKLDRKALPKPQLDQTGAEIPPRNTLERSIAQCWKDVLGIDRIGIRDAFFDLGGHSMLLLRLGNRLEQTLNRSIPITVLFEHPTIESLAAYFSGKAAAFDPGAAVFKENLRRGTDRLGRLFATSKFGQ